MNYAAPFAFTTSPITTTSSNSKRYTDEFFNIILRTVIQSVIIYTYPLKGQLWINIRVNIRTNKF